jgi:hypothetical protein
MNETEDTERGRKLLSAVERIIDDTDAIIAQVDRQRTFVRGLQPGIDEEALRGQVSERLVRHYSNAAAISGGATALPALFPGVGSLLALTGGTLLDVAFTLKFEVEMALALCWNHGFDIREERERRLAFLLASVMVHDESTGTNFLADVAQAEGEALWNYTPRQVPKILAQVLARIAARQAVRGAARLLPFVGIAVGAGLNKTLTTRTGRKMTEELTRRRAQGEHVVSREDVVEAAQAPGDDDVVEAAVAPPPAAPEAPPDPRAALAALSWDALRARARALGLPVRGKKDALIDAILAREAGRD